MFYAPLTPGRPQGKSGDSPEKDAMTDTTAFRGLFLLLLGLVLAPKVASQESPLERLEPGLVAEYFAFDRELQALPELAGTPAPTLVRIDPKVDYGPVRGGFYGTKLSQNFAARWTGLLTIEKEGLTNFYLDSEAGSRLFIDGELLVDNRDGRGMEQKADRIGLAKGRHSLRLEYFTGTGPAGLILGWKPPGALRTVVPEGVLFHRPDGARIPWDKDAWEKRPEGPPMDPVRVERQGQYAKTDYGSFLSRTVEEVKGTYTPKGLAIRVGPDATVCFDTELLRISAGWTGGYLKYPAERDGIFGLPRIDGTVRFSTRAGSLGWARRGVWTDPRPVPFGPLPADSGRYQGLYVHGERVVLAYSVGETDILELPGFESGAFTRTFQIGRSTGPLSVLLAEGEKAPGVAFSGLPPGTSLQRSAGRVELALPPTESPTRWKVRYSEGPVSPPEDLERLTHGGSARWPESIVTRGVRGKDSGAYAVDTLTIPLANPWDSYMRIVAFDFFPDGRAAVATLDGDVWIVSGIDDTLEHVVWKRFAAGLFQPLGLRIVDGVIYALGRDQITRLQDLNQDGEADYYENFNNGCMISTGFHEFAMNLETDSSGNFYYTKAATGGTLSIATPTPHYGCLLRVSKDGKKLDVVARGFRAPNGLAIGPGDEMVVTDNQGNWVPECPILWVTPGAFYGFVLKEFPETRTLRPEPPVAWLPMDLDNSSGGEAWVTSDRWGPFSGRLVHTSYGQSALFLVLLDEAGGVRQGGVARFPLRFSSGIMRARFHPRDGQLYVAGLRGWQTTGVADGCFQRVRYTGRPAYMPLSFHLRKSGIDLTFTDPLDRDSAGDLENYSAKWFGVVRTEGYGSPEFQVTDPGKRGREELRIDSVHVKDDGKTVSLEIPGLRPVTNLLVKCHIRAADGTPLAHEVSLTINRLPDR